jgi:hypothetical protein
MNEELRSILLGTMGLSVAGVVALCLTIARGSVAESGARIRGAVRITLVAILFQAAHFAEELATGFHEQFPAMLGLATWPLQFFVPFNLAWLAIWGFSAWGLAARWRAALFNLWFLGIGCIANGVAHPSFAVRAGGYFPGLVTAPFVGVVGVLLIGRLLVVTDSANASPGAC